MSGEKMRQSAVNVSLAEEISNVADDYIDELGELVKKIKEFRAKDRFEEYVFLHNMLFTMTNIVNIWSSKMRSTSYMNSLPNGYIAAIRKNVCDATIATITAELSIIDMLSQLKIMEETALKSITEDIFSHMYK